MRTEKQILDERARVDYLQRSILTKAAEEKRPMNPDENEQWERADKDFQALTKELEMVRAIHARDGIDNSPETPIMPIGAPQITESAKEKADKFYRSLIHGTGIEREEALAMMNNPMRASTSSTGTGLYVMPEEFIARLERKMKQFGGMLQASYIHRSSSGKPMRWPTHDGTTDTGNWVDQPRASDIVPRGLTFGRNSFAAYTWYDIIGLDWEFIQDEEVGLVAGILADMIGEAAGRALNKALTDGNGSSFITGILAASGGAEQGKETAANNAIVKTEFIDLIHSVDPAYRNGPNVAFMFNDNTLSRIRKLDFGTTDDEPIWQPSFAAGEPDRVLGYPYVINQDFPSLAASAKLAAFGDFSKYVVRQVQDMNIVRLNETFAARMQTAFLGWARYDGKLIQPAAIKLLQMKA
jgi:HK97 family phage major capsid protein